MKKWYVDITLMRGIGEHHGMVRLDIEQALYLMQHISQWYQNSVEPPADDVLLDEIFCGLSDLVSKYEYLNHMEQSGLD